MRRHSRRECGATPRAASREAGWTLVEIMIVAIILGVVAAIAVPLLWGAMTRGSEAAVTQDLRAVSSARSSLNKPDASIAELVANQRLDKTFAAVPLQRHNYDITEPAPGQVLAVHRSGVGRSYMLTPDGIIHYRDGAPAGPNDPSIGNR